MSDHLYSPQANLLQSYDQNSHSGQIQDLSKEANRNQNSSDLPTQHEIININNDFEKKEKKLLEEQLEGRFVYCYIMWHRVLLGVMVLLCLFNLISSPDPVQQIYPPLIFIVCLVLGINDGKDDVESQDLSSANKTLGKMIFYACIFLIFPGLIFILKPKEGFYRTFLIFMSKSCILQWIIGVGGAYRVRSILAKLERLN